MNELEYPKAYLYRRIILAKKYIDEHYASKIELNHLAEEAHFSKFHFARLFKNSYGCTPLQYLTRVRINKAVELLAQHKSVSQTCHEVGYESVNTFSSLFKKHLGIAPQKYALMHEEKKRELQENPLSFIPGCFAEKYGWKK